MATSLTREDIIHGLRELIAELRSDASQAGIRLVGGAALALRYFDRGTTQDLDSLHVHPGEDVAVAAAAGRVAERRGWAPDWLNFGVENTGALPAWGRTVEWETIYASDGIVIEVAAKETLLAMKLRANRPGRDTNDIRQLLTLCGITTLDEAAEFYEDFYPSEPLPDRAITLVTNIIEHGLPTAPERPGSIDLG